MHNHTSTTDIALRAHEITTMEQLTVRSKRKNLGPRVDENGAVVLHRRCLDGNDKPDRFQLLPDEIVEIVLFSCCSIGSTRNMAALRACTRFWSLRADVWIYIMNNSPSFDSVARLSVRMIMTNDVVSCSLRSDIATGLARIWCGGASLHTSLLETIGKRCPGFIFYALHAAVARHDPDTVRSMLSHQLGIKSAESSLIETALGAAGKGDGHYLRRVEVLRLLLGLRPTVCRPHISDMSEAIRQGWEDICVMLLPHYDEDSCSLWKENDHLRKASKKGMIELVDAMLTRKSGRTLNIEPALECAARKGHSNVIWRLLRYDQHAPLRHALRSALSFGRPDCYSTLMSWHAFLPLPLDRGFLGSHIEDIVEHIRRKLTRKQLRGETRLVSRRVVDYGKCLAILEKLPSE